MAAEAKSLDYKESVVATVYEDQPIDISWGRFPIQGFYQ
jgi:hypothetical protein